MLQLEFMIITMEKNSQLMILITLLIIMEIALQIILVHFGMKVVGVVQLVVM